MPRLGRLTAWRELRGRSEISSLRYNPAASSRQLLLWV